MSDHITPEALGVKSEFAPDNVFALLVHIANTSDLEMGITLHLNGQMITGRLISGATFWAESAQELRARGQGPPGLIEEMASSMEQVAEQYRNTFQQDTAVEDPSLTAFIHLRNAHTLAPQGPTPTVGALWRGRLSSVDGFTFGELRGIE